MWDNGLIHYIKKHNIKIDGRSRLNESKLKFDINYFDEINNEKKAYWLGFILADGCICRNDIIISLELFCLYMIH